MVLPSRLGLPVVFLSSCVSGGDREEVRTLLTLQDSKSHHPN